jgi:hypothetical protein
MGDYAWSLVVEGLAARHGELMRCWRVPLFRFAILAVVGVLAKP